MGRRLMWLLAGLVSALIVSSALGDTLVLRDGTRIETAGGFEVRSERVIFTDANGSLKSLSLGEVDMIATREFEESKVPDKPEKESEPNEPGTPVMVLKTGDILTQQEAERQRAEQEDAQLRRDWATGKVEMPARDSQRDRGRSRKAERGGPAEREGFATIADWSIDPSRQTGGLKVSGTVVNQSEKALDRVIVQVFVRDRKGKLLRSGRAFVDRTRLKPGWDSPFHFVETSLSSPKGLVIEFRVTARVLSWGARPRSSGD